MSLHASAIVGWQGISDKMRQTTDALGKGIDPGIFDTVVALNALGIPTVASCEGHLERAQASPWIEVEPPEVQAFRQQLRAQQELEGVERAPGTLYTPSAAVTSLRLTIKRQQLVARKPLMDVLDAFYRQRWVPYDRRIMVSSREWLGRTRLECQGTEFQEVAEPALRQQKLAEYQEEMRAFAAFLKTIYVERQGNKT